MTLFDVLAFYGALGDAACGASPGFALHKAAVAVSLARTAGASDADCDALYFAGLLHAVGAIDSPAYRKDDERSPRAVEVAAWDVPARGARVCAELPGIPQETADLVRWQAENWDGTGYPDQLRWHGIPRNAGILALADAYVRAAEPEEALASVSTQAGRTHSPELARTFTTWFHLTGGEPEPANAPVAQLADVDETKIADLLDRVADRVDAHNGVPGRWRRVAELTAAAAAGLALAADDRHALAIAVRLYGAGEVAVARSGHAAFDPLARLGIEQRAILAVAAAELIAAHSSLHIAAPVIRARAEWYDGTGKPLGLSRDAIPPAAGILAAAIAVDALDRTGRLETAAGTQFDPRIVRAVLEASKAAAS